MRSLISALVMAYCVAGMATPVPAEWKVLKGGDKMDDTTYSGLGTNSKDGKASLYFICDSGKKSPRILFLHPHFLTNKRFDLAYRIDKEKKAKGSSSRVPIIKADAIIPTGLKSRPGA